MLQTRAKPDYKQLKRLMIQGSKKEFVTSGVGSNRMSFNISAFDMSMVIFFKF